MFSEQIVRQKLKELRESKGITEEQAAHHLGKASNSSVNRIESGQIRLNFEIVEKLCELYSIDPVELFNSGKTTVENSIEKKGYLERLMFRSDTKATDKIANHVKELQPILRKLGSLLTKIETPPVTTYDIDCDYNEKLLSNPTAAYKYATSFASKLRAFLDIGPNVLIDIQDLCWKQLNIPICGLEMGDTVWGMYSRDRQDNPLIIYSQNPKNQQRNVFTIAHELGHHFFYKENLELDTEAYLNSTNIYEKVANKFAQELLVPINFLRKQYDEAGFSLLKEIKPGHVVELCNYFKVSYQMMVYCLLEARKISQAQHDALKVVSKSSLSELVGYQPESYLSPGSDLSAKLEEVTLIAFRTKKISKLEATSLLNITTDELLKKA